MRTDRLVYVRQLGRRFITRALLFILVLVIRGTEHLPKRLRRDAAGDQQRRHAQQQQHEQRPDRGQRPLEHDIQAACQQAARTAIHAGFQQGEQRFHRKIIFVGAGQRMDDTADKNRQQHNARPAQTDRPFFPHKQQSGQRKQRKRQHIAAPSDQSTDAAVQPVEQRAVDRQDCQQAQQARNAPDRPPRRARQRLLRFGRASRGLTAGSRFFGCGFFCSQSVFPSIHLLCRARTRAGFSPAQAG